MEKTYTFTEKDLKVRSDIALGMSLLTLLSLTFKNNLTKEEKEKKFNEARTILFELLTSDKNE
jgi:hypothetical protein